MSTTYTATLFSLLLFVDQTFVALDQRKMNLRMDEGEAKRNQAKANIDVK